jgi:DNA polymerase III subunit epsilon
MKHICLDTETTGFDPQKGDRIVEIACIELDNYIPTGRTYHQYIDPKMSMPKGAFEVHGLSDDFLRGKPVFADIAQDFVDFIQDIPLVIHNAKFDMKFLNYELVTLGYPPMPMSRAIDTLDIARKKFPGSPATLDALCKRFNISLEKRNLHGALIDTHLLAEVYLNLCDGRTPSLTLDTAQSPDKAVKYKNGEIYTAKKRSTPLPRTISESETEQHQEFISKFKASAIWNT